jgi:hypothetical protein
LIVGRSEKDNLKLLDVPQSGDLIFEPCAEIKGPVALGRGEFTDRDIEISTNIIAKYCDKDNLNIKIRVRRHLSDFDKLINCLPYQDSDLSPYRI